MERQANTRPADESAAPGSFLPHIAQGAAINYFGIFARMVLVYGYTFLLARMLTVEDLGAYFVMFSMVNLLGLASMVGLDQGVVRYVALYAGGGKLGLVRKTVIAAQMFGLPVAVLFTVGLLIAAPLVSDRFFDGSPEAVTGLRIFAFAIPFLVAARLFNATTQGMHRMRYQVLSRDFGEQIAKIALSGAALIMGLGLIGVIWANLASMAVAMGISFFFALIVLAGPVKGDEAGARPAIAVLRYSYPLAFANIISALLLSIDTLILGLLGTPEDVGLFGVALRISLLSSKIIMAFIIVFAPVIAHLWNQNRTDELADLYSTVSRWIFTLSLPFFLVMVLFPNSLMQIFGEGYLEGSSALIILAIGQFLAAATGAVGLMVLMTGRSKIELMNVTVALSTDVALCMLLIPRYGTTGAAIAHMSALGIVNLLRVVEIWILMRMHAYNLCYLKPVLAGGAAAVLAGLAGKFVIGDGGTVQVAVLVGLLLLVYVLFMVFLGLDEQEKALLKKLKTSAAQLRAA